MIILFILFQSMTLPTIRYTTESIQYCKYNNNEAYIVEQNTNRKKKPFIREKCR